ncbi:MAG: hypothetical protein U0520_00525 [Candidatus Saccharimonadales bacterium]
MDDFQNPQEPAQASVSEAVPQTPTPPPATFVTPPEPANLRKSNKKGLFIGFALAFVVLLTGGGAFAFYNYQNNKPEKVLADALANTISSFGEESSSTTLGSLTYEYKGDQSVKVKVAFEGKATGEDGQGSADITLDFAGRMYTVKTSAVVFGEDEVYFKVEKLKALVDQLLLNNPEAAAYGEYVNPIVAKVDNRWIKITKNDISKLSSASKDEVDTCTEALKSFKISKDDSKQLKKLFNENQFIVVSEKLKNQTAANESSFHYKLDFNNAAAESFAKEVITLESFKTIKQDCELDEKKIAEGFKDAKDGVAKEASKPVVELWVGKKTRRPTKFRVSADDKDITVDFSSEFRFGAEDVLIERPKKSISVTDLKEEFERIMPSATSARVDVNE